MTVLHSLADAWYDVPYGRSEAQLEAYEKGRAEVLARLRVFLESTHHADFLADDQREELWGDAVRKGRGDVYAIADRYEAEFQLLMARIMRLLLLGD